jgi:Flp pilus assembly protein TadB
VRGYLRQTEENCLKVPGRAAWQTLPRWIPAPVPVAAAVFAVLAVATLAAWWLLDLAPLAVVLLVALAGVPALVARAAAERMTLSLKRHIAREYPARLCRQYLQAFDAGVAEYEKRVTGAAAEAG